MSLHATERDLKKSVLKIRKHHISNTSAGEQVVKAGNECFLAEKELILSLLQRAY